MKILLLNSGYEPINFVSEKKAIKHILNQKAEIISSWNCGLRYDNGYCLVCGVNLKFYPNARKISYKNKNHIVCSHNCEEYFLIDPSEFLMPSIIRLKKYTPRHNKKNKVYNRGAIFKRDKNTCQYCGKKFQTSELTIDHVMPKSMGGKTSWENCVACCNDCNSKKANRTPKMAQMKLLYKPFKPNITIWHYYNSLSKKHEDWDLYFFQSGT